MSRYLQVRSFIRRQMRGGNPVDDSVGCWVMPAMNTNCDVLRSWETFTPDQVRVPVWKRILDTTLIVIALPFLLPLMLLIALLIRSVSTGSALYSQERVGYQGRRFRFFKFRTMRVDADDSIHRRYLKHLIQAEVPMVKMDSQGDRRIIPCGLFLRSSGLDELPQIINVLRGEMSMVGPRPCLPYEFDQYLPWQKERFNTLPGLTGLWQVSGKNRTTFLEMIRLDIAYAYRKSLWLDLQIIFKTVPALLVQIYDVQKQRRRSLRPRQTAADVSR